MNIGMAVSSSTTTWRELYNAALFETDKCKLAQCIADAEKALIMRAIELFHADGDHIEEQELLEDAMYALDALRSIAESSRYGSELESLSENGTQAA